MSPRRTAPLPQAPSRNWATWAPLLAWLQAQAGPAGLTLFILGFSALGIAVHAWQARRRALSG